MVAWRITKPDGRRRRVALNVAAQLFLVGWVLLMVNGWVFYYSWPVDLTEDERFTLPPETITLLESLETPVEVVIPFRFGSDLKGVLERKVFQRASRVLLEMERVSPANLRVVKQLEVGADPDEWQLVQAEYKLESINRIYLITPDRREVLAPSDLAVFRSVDELALGEQTELIAENVVEALTVALRRVVQAERPQILITQGHGEMPIEAMSVFARDIAERGFDVRPINLREVQQIPEETDLLVIACHGTQQGFDGFGRDVVSILESFVERGGALFMTLPFDRPTGLEECLSKHGIDVLPGDVARVGVDNKGLKRANRGFTTPFFNKEHPITRRFEAGKDQAHFYVSRALDGSADTLLMTGEDCWLETTTTLRRDAAEQTGPFRIAMASKGDQSRIVVFGPVFVTLDKHYSGVARQTLLNSIFWLTHQETLSAGSLASETTRRIQLNDKTQSAFFWTCIFVVPGCSILAGLLAAWFRRR